MHRQCKNTQVIIKYTYNIKNIGNQLSTKKRKKKKMLSALTRLVQVRVKAEPAMTED